MMNNNTMNIFAQTLIANKTVAKKSAARITGDKVGLDNLTKWQSAMTTAQQAFYNYEKAVDDKVKGKGDCVESAKNAGMSALQTIFDLVGKVNGHAISKDDDLFAKLAKTAIYLKTELKGEALTIQSQLKNLDKELDSASNGVNPEWLEAKQEEYNTLESKFNALKNLPESGDTKPACRSFNAFCSEFERELSVTISGQAMKSWEELEAEKEAKRQERRAKTKAKQQAKKQAEAQAKSAK